MIKNFIDKTKLLFSIYANYFQKFLNLLNKYSKIILFIAFVGFAILTTVGILHSEPWFDEAQAWLIAKNLGPIEILKHMKYEGHMFMWFYVLKPLTKLNIPYPLPMQIANMLFMWGAVLIFLKKAPMNPVLKVLIIFSVPFAYQYAVVARCYAIGIFFLFLLAAFYKDKLKHPYWYALLIFLCANTSVVALFGAAAFGGLFFFDYVKEKPEFYKSKEFYILCAIALSCVGILAFQLLGAHQQQAVLQDLTPIKQIKNPLILLPLVSVNGLLFKSSFHSAFNMAFTVIFLLLSIYSFRKNLKVLFFFLTTVLGLFVTFLTVYNGFAWHHFFLYIYLVISFWLLCDDTENKKGIAYTLLAAFLVLITLRLNLVTFIYSKFNYSNITSYSKQVAEHVSENSKIMSGNIVICDEMSHSVVPYFDNKGLTVMECLDGKQNSYFNRAQSLDFILKSKSLVPDIFKKFESKDIYLIVENNNQTQLYSNYYKLSLEFCEKPAISDNLQLCVVKLTPGY